MNALKDDPKKLPVQISSNQRWLARIFWKMRIQISNDCLEEHFGLLQNHMLQSKVEQFHSFGKTPHV